MALSWRVNQPLIIVKYNYKNKGGLQNRRSYGRMRTGREISWSHGI